MTQLKDSFSDDLEQIRNGQLAVLDQIDAIREQHGSLPREIEKIQKDALAIVHEIDQIKERQQFQEEPK